MNKQKERQREFKDQLKDYKNQKIKENKEKIQKIVKEAQLTDHNKIKLLTELLTKDYEMKEYDEVLNTIFDDNYYREDDKDIKKIISENQNELNNLNT